MTKKIIYITAIFLVLASTAIFIFSNSMLSGEDSNQKSGVIVELIRPIIDPDGRMATYEIQYIVRKTAHFMEFFVFGASLTAISFLIGKKIFTPWIFMPMFLTLAAAVADEYVQSFTGRTSLVSDIVIDFSGGISGIVLAVIIYAIIRAVKNRKTKLTEIELNIK